MATRLSVYNGALGYLGQRRLASLTEDNESRRLCDSLWIEGQIVRYLLEEGLWKFALRTSRIEATPSYAPGEAFLGAYRCAFEKSEDWVRTARVSDDPQFSFPLLRYSEEAGFLYAERDPVWVQFVSDDDEYGGDPSHWTTTFEAWAHLYIAFRLAPSINSSKADMENLERLMLRARLDALAKDAMQGPTVFPPLGSWANARRRGSQRRGARWEGA